MMSMKNRIQEKCCSNGSFHATLEGIKICNNEISLFFSVHCNTIFGINVLRFPSFSKYHYKYHYIVTKNNILTNRATLLEFSLFCSTIETTCIFGCLAAVTARRRGLAFTVSYQW